MIKINLKLYPVAWLGMANWILNKFIDIELNLKERKFDYIPATDLVLHAFAPNVSQTKVDAWNSRNKLKTYNVSLPIHIAYILVIDMQHRTYTPGQQEFLGILHQSLISFGFSPESLKVIQGEELQTSDDLLQQHYFGGGADIYSH